MRLVFVLLASVCTIGSASAQMAVFQTEMMAKMHCPDDKVVWLDLTKRKYYTEGQKRYGKGRTALFVCREEARRSGYKHSLLGRR